MREALDPKTDVRLRTVTARPDGTTGQLLDVTRLCRSPSSRARASEPCTAVDGVSFTVDAGPGRRPGRRVRLRQDASPPGDHGAAARARASQVTGEVLFDGTDLLELDAGRRCATCAAGTSRMIFQDPLSSLNPVDPDRRAGRRGAGAAPGHDQERGAARGGRELLDAVGIPDPDRRLKEYPHQLSGGMRQRALIAIALACEPRLLIADEPTTALDVTIQAQILELLKELVDETGTALIMITHDLGVVAGLCDTVNVLYAGRVVETAEPPASCSPTPRHPYTDGLLGSIPRLDAPRGEPLHADPRLGRRQHPVGRGLRLRAPLRRLIDACLDAAAGRSVDAYRVRNPGQQRACRHRCCGGGPAPATPVAPGAESRPAGLTPAGADRAGRSGERRRRSAGVTGTPLSRRDLKVHFPIKRGVLFDRTVGHVYAVDGVVARRSRGARRTGWWASPAAASRRSAGRCCGWSSRPSGEVFFDGTDVARCSRREPLRAMRRRMQMVFQDPLSSLDPRQNVESLLTEGLKAHGHRPTTRSRATGERSAARLLDAVGLPPSALARYPHEFSGGQRQRIGIARALVLEPGPDHRRRAGLRAGRLDPGAGAQPAGGAAGRAGADLPGHRARPGGGPAHLATRSGVMYLGALVEEAPATTLYARAAAPVHQGADVGGPGAGPGGGGPPGADPARRRPALARRTRRPAAGSTPAARGRSRPAATTSARRCASSATGTGWPATGPRRSPPGGLRPHEVDAGAGPAATERASNATVVSAPSEPGSSSCRPGRGGRRVRPPPGSALHRGDPCGRCDTPDRPPE